MKKPVKKHRASKKPVRIFRSEIGEWKKPVRILYTVIVGFIWGATAVLVGEFIGLVLLGTPLTSY